MRSYGLLGQACLPPYFQLLQKKSREREAPIRGARLRFLKSAFLECPANVKLTAFPVDVAPGHTQDLTDPAAHEHRERDQQSIAVGDELPVAVSGGNCRFAQRCNFFRCEDIHPGPLFERSFISCMVDILGRVSH